MVQFTTKLPQPTSVSAGSVSATSIEVSWTDNTTTGNVTYYVDYSTDGGSTWTNFSTLGSNATSETITSLQSGIQYDVRVRASTSDKTTSSLGSATTLAVPDGVSISQSGDDITISWNAVTCDGYHIYRAQSSGSSVSDYTRIGDVSPSTTSYSDTNLLDGEKYFYIVTSYINV